MMVKPDPAILLHELIAATAAFAFATVFARRWAVVVAALVVAFVASLGWRMLTPTLWFIWHQLLWYNTGEWLCIRWDSAEPWVAVLAFWIIPALTACAIVSVHRKWLKEDRRRTWQIVVIGVLLATGALLLAVRA